MSNNELIIIDEDSIDRANIEWNEWHMFTMSAHYKCPQCSKRLIKIDIPYHDKQSKIRYKPLYRCGDCNIFLRWERRVK